MRSSCWEIGMLQASFSLSKATDKNLGAPEKFQDAQHHSSKHDYFTVITMIGSGVKKFFKETAWNKPNVSCRRSKPTAAELLGPYKENPYTCNFGCGYRDVYLDRKDAVQRKIYDKLRPLLVSKGLKEHQIHTLMNLEHYLCTLCGSPVECAVNPRQKNTISAGENPDLNGESFLEFLKQVKELWVQRMVARKKTSGERDTERALGVL
ncbi:Protein of unknown function [Pyronema omphalodes CBS 100304]|uniref:Uncharacterized protein n=1 Tax=Pyronema omphalodes (strain CBS 100304) TaxID=1076935 RepID=U4L4H1_PYROM|nr:Protein of unknown function [Pyronema omphalodes CBS 100304]